MEVEVIKLGGSILKNFNDFQRISKIISNKRSQDKLPVCVISAMKGVTDKIIYALGAIRTDANFSPHAFIEELFNEHSTSLPDITLKKDLMHEFNKLVDVFNYVKSSGELSDSVYAYTVSRGENFASKILSYHLEAAGIKCHSLYGEDLLVTDD
ncbi:hypothetical protein FJY84_08655, partial [Candidatus Bathyarchaeota archaeon]|nr:hypothetical protein [Candidatus Bathyarchaeota archaeon]